MIFHIICFNQEILCKNVKKYKHIFQQKNITNISWSKTRIKHQLTLFDLLYTKSYRNVFYYPKYFTSRIDVITRVDLMLKAKIMYMSYTKMMVFTQRIALLV